MSPGREPELGELVARCLAHLEAVEEELLEFSWRQQVFEGVAEIVKANPEIDKPSVFYDLLVGSFAHYCMATVRRLVDRRPDSKSLARLLIELNKDRGLVTREAWTAWAAKGETAKFGRKEALRLASKAFDKIAGADQDALTKPVLRDLVGRLNKSTARIKDFADTYVAHHGMQRELGELEFSEIFAAMDEVRRIYGLCALLVAYKTSDATMNILVPWKRLFEVPWIGGAKRGRGTR